MHLQLDLNSKSGLSDVWNWLGSGPSLVEASGGVKVLTGLETFARSWPFGILHLICSQKTRVQKAFALLLFFHNWDVVAWGKLSLEINEEAIQKEGVSLRFPLLFPLHPCLLIYFCLLDYTTI